VYWGVGPTAYQRQADGSLRPRSVTNGRDVWQSPADNGYVAAPLSADDVQFRQLHARVGATSAQLGAVFPALHAVGRFDPAQLTGGRSEVEAALSTAVSPGLQPADERTGDLLQKRPLLPNGNIAGYQTQAPLLLTNLRSLPAFAGPNFTPNQGRAPISAIRVRVSGVVGIDAASRERVRQTAQAITAATGLDVDLTVGSSAQRRVIDLPAGRHGRPALRLIESWARKGVGLTIISAIDRKSVALFLLVLGVCVLFVTNATTAAVSARRTQLAILASLGWPPRALFLSIFGEVAVIGLVAGILGGAISLAAAPLLGMATSATRVLLALPAAVLLCVLAALPPARRAARAHPAEALRPPVRLETSGSSASGITGLALINLRRTPGRSLTAAAAMALAVAALTILLAITLAFRGAVVGSVLGNAVAVEVRTVDYIAAAIMIALGTAGIADVIYLNLRERAAEIAVLRATGWSERHVTRLVVTEAALTGAGGALLGAALGLLVATLLTGSLELDATLAAGAAAAGAVTIATASGFVPAYLAGRRTIAAGLRTDP
jgi:putative ABC transport system permease protein